jgi:hypothetical protein
MAVTILLLFCDRLVYMVLQGTRICLGWERRGDLWIILSTGVSIQGCPKLSR